LTGGGMALAGLIIGYLMLAFSVLTFAGAVVQARNRARELTQEIRSKAQANNGGPQVVITGNSPSRTPAPAAPAGAVSGNIKGDVFTYTKSSLNTNMGLFSVSDGADFIADRSVQIFLFPKAGENLANRTWKINAAAVGSNPHVHLRWQENGKPQMDTAMSGYQLELTTGTIVNGVVTGTLNLKVTGKVPAELKGNFSAVVE
jgi:hypothetical protein